MHIKAESYTQKPEDNNNKKKLTFILYKINVLNAYNVYCVFEYIYYKNINITIVFFFFLIIYILIIL